MKYLIWKNYDLAEYIDVYSLFVFICNIRYIGLYRAFLSIRQLR